MTANQIKASIEAAAILHTFPIRTARVSDEGREFEIFVTFNVARATEAERIKSFPMRLSKFDLQRWGVDHSGPLVVSRMKEAAQRWENMPVEQDA